MSADFVGWATVVLLFLITILLSVIALLLFCMFLTLKSIQVDSVMAARAALKRKFDQYNSQQ